MSKVRLPFGAILLSSQRLSVHLTYRETELIRLLKQKDHQAFTYLYDRYASALYTIVVQIVKDEETANNVLQEVFICIWRDIVQYDPTKEKLFTWMLKTARKKAVDKTRGRFHQKKTQQPSGDGVLYRSHAATDHCGLKQAIAKLSKEQLTLINLCYYEGFTVEQIAGALGVAVETVQTNIKVAVKELNTMLSQ